MTDATTTDALVTRALAGLCEAVPSLPSDSLNEPLARRLQVLLLAAQAVANAIPENDDPLPPATSIALAGLAQVTATRIRLQVYGHDPAETIPVLPQLPPKWGLPRFSEAWE
mgnify:CR=1 FL=1